MLDCIKLLHRNLSFVQSLYILIMIFKSVLPTVMIFLLCLAFAIQEAVADQEDPAVTRLRSYLRIQSAHPNPEAGYEQVTQWMRQQAEEIGLDFHFLRFEEPAQFALWMTWNGTNPTLKSVLFNSHQDVVIADPEKWTHPPYEAHKDAEGNIFGRGSVDMKGATIAELEAIRRLKASGFQPLRTIHLSIMPDEEMGGLKGMQQFVKSDAFKRLNVGIDIDEGIPGRSNDIIKIAYGEKTMWRFNITAKGEASHSSGLPEYTAGQRLQVVIDRLMKFRQSEYKKLKEGVPLEELTTINLVRLGGGVGDNTIPSEVWASFDMRMWLGPGWNFTDVENMINRTLEEARLPGPNNDVTISYLVQSFEAGKTVINDTNVWWTVVQDTCQELNVTCPAAILSPVTDARFVRTLGIPALGICPFPYNANGPHQDDESINERDFLRGIDRYMVFIRNLANSPRENDPCPLCI